ncbi:hypothetical protein BT93_C0302 [Corymbia citriodora subsp. variegata]|nr:hypothetical protein BT93_C0302 [Corymbia citriodora subsp. variegata]
MTSCSVKQKKLEHIDEHGPANLLPLQASCMTPETPIESMEFLARSWSVSAMELSKALHTTHVSGGNDNNDNAERSSFSSVGTDTNDANSRSPRDYLPQQPPANETESISPRDSGEVRELFLLHQALNPEFLANQQLLRNGIYKNIMRGKTIGRWLKDQKERKKQETRAHNAQLHAAVSVAGVAAAVAVLAASNATMTEQPTNQQKKHARTSTAIASAAALVASHCIDLAEEMGADHQQITAVVSSAVSARTNGDIMALTAGAATALRGASTLRARLQKGYGGSTFAMAEDKGEADKENYMSMSNALDFASKGGELLKRTRKGALHWKQVSFNVNSNFQVVAKLKSKHVAGTFTKKKKCVVTGVHHDIPVWTGREKEDGGEKAYFGIVTTDRMIEFECQSKEDKQMWTEGIQQMLNYCSNMI